MRGADPNVATCKSCGAAIRWVMDQNGTRLPLNKTRVRAYEVDGQGKATYAMSEKGKPMLVHVSHFVSCPHATAHSRAVPPQPPPNETLRETPPPPTA